MEALKGKRKDQFFDREEYGHKEGVEKQKTTLAEQQTEPGISQKHKRVVERDGSVQNRTKVRTKVSAGMSWQIQKLYHGKGGGWDILREGNHTATSKRE